MQKKLIALAVASVVSAPAFAGVNVYGVVDAAALNRSVTGTKSALVAISGGLAGSRVGVVADEDLDNGMKAIAKVEYALDAAVSGGVGNARQEMLALAGGFGTVAAGYLQTAGYDWQVKFDPTAGSQVSPLQYVNASNATLGTAQPFLLGTAAAAKRANHALAYISPDLGGVTVAVNYSTSMDGVAATDETLGTIVLSGDSVPATNRTTAMLLSATYSGGPLTVGGVYAATGNDGSGFAKTTDMGLGASYDLGVAKLFGTYQTNKTDTAGATTNKAMSFSVVAPVGPGALVGSYAKNTMGGTGNDDSGMTVAYLMGLSKTTTAYAALNKNTFKTASVSTDVTLLAVGVKKAF